MFPKSSSKRKWLGFCSITVLGIFYLTLYPFHFAIPFDQALGRFDLTLPWVKHHSRLDFLSNVLFFLPFGFGLAKFLNHLSWVRRLLWIIFLAFVLSFTVEFLQLFIPERNAALMDILANVTGACLGAGVASLTAFDHLLPKPLPKALVFLGTAFFLLYEPFDFTFDLGELKAHLKSVTFSFSWVNLFWPAYFLALTGLWWPSVSPLGGAILVTFLAGLLEIGRIWVCSVTLSLSKALARILLSLFFYLILRSLPQRLRKRGALFLFAICLLFEAWYPFRWRNPFLSGKAWLPFFFYFQNFTLGALFHLLEILLIFFAWGLIWGLEGPSSLKKALLGAFGLSVLAESGQIFIQGRTPDLTTALLAVLGVWTSFKIQREGRNDLQRGL